ncbi:Sensor protein FixL [Hartmannibacter diazotrophicus]|uniref:Sensor protein FixL n=1 Tax=Hartmannibacter diazotrophicus TaxID=1482074 RepID=A0A2C9DBH8_9HYPH|nr:PAS domain-containing protein [Hartmannibacter diazotrophicus]SON57692.1 Sensor protein FixL [Hartmannibacter diazotrophicus]
MASFDHEQLVAVIPDAVIVSGPDGRITFWNAAAERIFGFSAEEAIGQSLDLIIPERQRPAHWNGYEKTMQTGVTRYGTSLLKVPALHKDGSSLSIAFTVALMHDADGTISGIVAVVRDETERWQQDRELRRKLKELQAKVAE